MTDVIVDTDVVSFIFKNDTRAALYNRHITSINAAISFMTLAELEQWARLYNWGLQRKAKLKSYIFEKFVVIHSTNEICELWSEVRAAAKNSGKHIQPSDAWIAATAMFFNVPLITHNADDYSGVSGLKVISESF